MTGTWIVRYHDPDGIPTAMVAGNRACERSFPTRQAANTWWSEWIGSGGMCFTIEHVEEPTTEPVDQASLKWEPIQRMIATAYAAGRADQRYRPVDSVDLPRFLAAVEAAGVLFGDFQDLYERMAREDAAPETHAKYQARKDAA